MTAVQEFLQDILAQSSDSRQRERALELKCDNGRRNAFEKFINEERLTLAPSRKSIRSMVGLAVVVMFSNRLVKLIVRFGGEVRDETMALPAAVRVNTSLRELTLGTVPGYSPWVPCSPWVRELADALRVNQTIMMLKWPYGSYEESLPIPSDEDYLVEAWRSNQSRPPRGNHTEGTLLTAQEKEHARLEAMEARRQYAIRQAARLAKLEAEEVRRNPASTAKGCNHWFDFIGGGSERCSKCGLIK